jgi:hypothetical protein
MNSRFLAACSFLIASLILITRSLAADDPPKSPTLSYDLHMSDCENRWVALYHKPEDSDYTYGFVHIDPQAGFTVQYGGRFTIDANGKYRLAPNPIPPDKMNLKIRLDRNGVAALLPHEALAELGLPEKPDWLKFYEDKADPITHKVRWGSFTTASETRAERSTISNLPIGNDLTRLSSCSSCLCLQRT